MLSVVGVDGRGAEPVATELPGSTTRADLLARTGAGIVHVEFVKDAAPDLDLRMLDYRLRLRRRDREIPIGQYVLALTEIAVPTCSWAVVRLADLDPAGLLASPTTAPLAPLACRNGVEQAAFLTSATELIKADTDPDRGARLVGAAIMLASIVLPGSAIMRALREADMPVPVRDTPLGRELFEEGRREGREEGREVGRHEAAARMATAWLRQRFGNDARIPALADHLAELSDEDRIDRITAATSLDALVDP